MVKNIAVMASGGGSNFENLAVKSDFLNMKIKVLIIDSPEIYAAERAERLKIPCRIVNRQDFKSKREFEAGIMSALADFEIDYIVLAGFMRILSADFINRYENKIINLHPSLLPAFKGKNGIEDAFNYGVKVTGVTVHFVDAGIDTGKIIDQAAVIIEDGDTLATLEEKIHQTEYELYPAALKKVFDGRV